MHTTRCRVVAGSNRMKTIKLIIKTDRRNPLTIVKDVFKLKGIFEVSKIDEIHCFTYTKEDK